MYKVTLINGKERTVIHYPNFSDIKVLSGQIKQGISTADAFTFNISIDNPGYQLIKPFQTLVEVLNTKTGKFEFEGRVSHPYDEMSEEGIIYNTFDCEGELAYLNDSSQRHGEYHNISVREFLQIIINNHNRDIQDDEIDKTFKLGIVDVDSSTGELYRYLGYENTYETIKDKLIDRLGGELRIRKENGIRYLDYVKEAGEVKKTEIRLAKNLKSISREVDPTEVITRLIPLGERIESEDEEATDASEARLTINSVNSGKDYIDDIVAMAQFGVIAASNAWDDITQPNILKTRGQQFLKENNRVKAKYQISALDLSLIGLDVDSYEVGNYYPVINPIMGIDEKLRVIGKTLDILEPESSSLEIGDKFMTASQYQYEANKEKKNIVDLRSRLVAQNKKVVNLSKASKEAQEKIEHMQQIIDNSNLENIDQTLFEINEQLFDLFESVGDIGKEIASLRDRMFELETFKDAQYQVNTNQDVRNSDFEQRLSKLENKEPEPPGGSDNHG